ncbi:MAG: hypothetical protein QME81_17220 [bacterium]|nr:hypothetical protein [bacterium]
MSIKIALYFKETVDLELLEKGVGIKLVRIIPSLWIIKEGD